MVAFRDGCCSNDDATFDSFPLLYIGGCISVMGEVEAAADRLSFERAHGCCDNGDRLVAAHRSHVLGNICQRGERSGSRDAARCSRGRSCLTAFRERRCENDDATFNSFPLLSIGILCGIYNGGSFWQTSCPSFFERAQFAWSRFVTGVVTMMTRNSIAFRSYMSGIYPSYSPVVSLSV